MPIKVNCLGCNAILQAPDTAAGKTIRCPRCGTLAMAPSPAAVVVEVPEPAEQPVSTNRRPRRQERTAPPQRSQGRNQTRSGRTEPRKGINGLGIASIIVSGVGLLVSLVPCLGWIIGLPIASIGLLLGFFGLLVALTTRKAGIATPLAGLAVGFVAIGISVAYWLLFSHIATEPERIIAEANQDHEQGRRAEAVAVYKENFHRPSLQPEQQREFLKRIVEYELQQGNKDEAQRWVKEGLGLSLDVSYETQAARDLVALIKEQLRGEAVERPNAGNGGGGKPPEVVLRLPRASLTGHKGDVESVAYSGDGKFLASGSEDETIKLWDANTDKEAATLKVRDSRVLSVAFSPDSKMLASGGDDKSIKLWDLATRKKRATLQGHTGWVTSVRFSPDGNTLASSSLALGEATIKLWDVAAEKERASLKGHKGAIHLSWSPDSKTLASGCTLGTLKLWNVEPGKEQLVFDARTMSVMALAYCPDGKTVAWGGSSGIKLLDVQAKTERPFGGPETEKATITALAYSQDGKTLASASSDHTITLWDVSTGKANASLKGHTDAVTALVFSPDGKTLASGSRDGTIKLWKLVGAALPGE
jgi:WD40 repeat protein